MKVIVNKTCATISGAEMLTSGMVGKTIDVEFSADWLGLIKIAVFTNGAVTRDVLDPNGTVIIPWDVLATPNKRTSVGFYGYKMENGEKVLAIPTIWAELGAIRAGADPSGDPSAELSPTVAEQLQSDVNDLDERVTEIEEHGGGGGTSDYTDLDNKPQINGVELSGNKTTEQLGIEIPSLAGYATEQWVEGKGYLTEHQSLSAYRTASAQDEIDNGKLNASEIKLDPNNRVYKIGSNFIAAEYDSNGAVISSTYAKKTELSDYALKTDLSELQTQSITDTAGYFTSDTVEGALAEIGAELAGINTLIGSGVIT